ncbi:mitochondrial inner membrane protein OXA1L [Linepithema humile]|uniref:mitochondrial inner membrane protein OXA1L n=1 Tax=Linepithema humile TaxID=83485 RepID=UPI000623789A|nr:PREDICTED: mitochondrial inner membrane protein OXA1L [Linepithema humile]XP_012225133.1 PREDICTED: mitochondrial inner membrane protein OXA1L [Linepithema humile]
MLTRISTIVCRQGLLKTNMISQKAVTHRHIHLVTQVNRTPRSNSLLNLYKHYRVTGISLVRYASTNEIPSQSSPYDEIPDPPAPLQEIVENVVTMHPNGEATFESLGLGGYGPVGLIQNFLEFMHISCDIPWWGAIVVGTVCARTIIFPLVIMSQKNAIKFSNHMPVIQELQRKMTDARYSGDPLESAKAAGELMNYMKKNGVSAVKNIMMPLIQAPIFCSFFFALRSMTNLPLDSLKQGGFWWLTDLTIPDPYYIMPIITSVTMYITIELATDGVNLQMMGVMRYVVRVMPFILLPFMINFPGAILTYWVSTNFISLIQTGVLKIPYVRKALKMPVLVRHKPVPSVSKKNFIEEFKESWTNMKISRQLSERERADAVQFNSAGKGPLVKTFKYDPIKQKKQSTVLTKGR